MQEHHDHECRYHFRPRPGQIQERGLRSLGRSDRIAAYPAEDPYTPQDLTASILDALGVNSHLQVRDGFGRDVPLSTGQVQPALFVG